MIKTRFSDMKTARDKYVAKWQKSEKQFQAETIYD